MLQLHIGYRKRSKRTRSKCAGNKNVSITINRIYMVVVHLFIIVVAVVMPCEFTHSIISRFFSTRRTPITILKNEKKIRSNFHGCRQVSEPSECTSKQSSINNPHILCRRQCSPMFYRCLFCACHFSSHRIIDAIKDKKNAHNNHINGSLLPLDKQHNDLF